MSRRVAIIGGNGQLGQDLQRHWKDALPADEVVALSHADIEVANASSVASALGQCSPNLVINTAAYHVVDPIEDNSDRAFAVNTAGVRNVALACRDLDAVLIHISTDYVFSGTSSRPYVEEDPVEPINAYGVSKAAGEMLLRYIWPKHYIVRTSGLYGLAGSSGKGGNFVETMLKLAARDAPIRVVDDQVLTPTGTRSLARQIAVLAGEAAHGTYHATCRGQCSWYEFASEIFRLSAVKPQLLPQTTRESGATARRPRYSVLENRRLGTLGIELMPDWRESLWDYLTVRKDASEPSPNTRIDHWTGR